MDDALVVARRDVPAGGGHRVSFADRRPALRGDEAAHAYGAVLRAAGPPTSPADVTPLLSRPSARERDVLRLLADGYSTREVARRLAYSERTIKNILQGLTTRLQLRNRTQAVALAVRNGWI